MSTALTTATTTTKPTAVPAGGVVLTTAEAVRRYGRGHVRAQLAAGRWQRPTRGVIVLHNGPLSDGQLAWAALLCCPEGAALAGLTALTIDGLEGFELRGLKRQVVLPEGAVRPSSALVAPYWSTELSARDIHPLKRPRRTRPQRSLVDEAAWSTAPRRSRALILAGVQQGLARPADVRDALSRRGPCRHRALIKESILDAEGGKHSLPERDFDGVLRRFGVPAPTRQRVLSRPDGRFFLDACWDEFDSAVEIHGIPHLSVLHWDKDLFRANEIAIMGPRLLAFTSYAVRHEPEIVGEQLVRLLGRQGWRG